MICDLCAQFDILSAEKSLECKAPSEKEARQQLDVVCQLLVDPELRYASIPLSSESELYLEFVKKDHLETLEEDYEVKVLCCCKF